MHGIWNAYGKVEVCTKPNLRRYRHPRCPSECQWSTLVPGTDTILHKPVTDRVTRLSLYRHHSMVILRTQTYTIQCQSLLRLLYTLQHTMFLKSIPTHLHRFLFQMFH